MFHFHSSNFYVASRILTYPGEYDDVIPENISLAEFILKEIEQFGDDVSSVRKPCDS